MVAILFFSYLCFHGLNTDTSVYIEIKGGSTVLSGILAAIYSTTAGIIRMVVGPIVDRRGRTVVMMAGASFFVAGALLVGFMQDTTALVIGRILQGIGFGSIVTSATTAASDMLPSSRMGEGLSYFAIGSALSQAVGPALALGMVALNPPEIMYYVLAGVAAVVFILALICDYEKHPERLSVESAFRQRCEAAAESGQQSTAEMLSASQEEYTGIKRFVEPAALSGAIPMMCMNAGNAFPCFFCGPLRRNRPGTDQHWRHHRHLGLPARHHYLGRFRGPDLLDGRVLLPRLGQEEAVVIPRMRQLGTILN